MKTKENIQLILENMNYKIQDEYILDENNNIIRNQYNKPINVDEVLGICDGLLITI
jgi:hypothetical protein